MSTRRRCETRYRSLEWYRGVDVRNRRREGVDLRAGMTKRMEAWVGWGERVGGVACVPGLGDGEGSIRHGVGGGGY